jgi:hypothetical protein
MEFLGKTENLFKKEKTKWKPIDLVFENDEKFCEATSKLINGFNGECNFVVTGRNNEKYFVDILDYRYISTDNTIRIFPENVKNIKN